MILEKINFKDLKRIIDKKLFILLIAISTATIFISSLEIVGIGILASFVLFLSDIKSFASNLPDFYIFNYFKELNQKELINLFLLIIIIFFIVKNCLIFVFLFFFNKFRILFNYSISKKLLNKYLSKNYEFYLANKNSNLIYNIREETVRFTGLIFSLINILKEFFLITFLLICIFVVNWKVTSIATFFLGSISIFIFLLIKKKLYKLGKDQTYYASTLIKKLIETFSDIKFIKVRSLEKFFSNKILFNQKELLKVGFYQSVIICLPRLLLELFAVIGLSVTIYIFLNMNYSFNEIIPIITFLALAIIRMVPAIASLNSNISNVTTNLISLEIVSKHFKNEEKSSRLNLVKNLNDKYHQINSIELKNVSFKYIDQKNDVLKNINFKLFKSDILGIIGDSGSGKTTLADIIIGLLEPQNGEILINNIPIKIDQFSKYKISYMPQSINILDEKLDLNIAYGVDEKEINKEKIKKSLKFSELEGIGNKFYEKKMGESGLNISGGQKQRIGFAKSIYNDPDLIVLDEPTSDLDFKTQGKIMNNLKLSSANKINIIIAHRLNTLDICNKLLIIDNGKIIDFGKKEQILEKHSDINIFFKKNIN